MNQQHQISHDLRAFLLSRDLAELAVLKLRVDAYGRPHFEQAYRAEQLLSNLERFGIQVRESPCTTEQNS